MTKKPPTRKQRTPRVRYELWSIDGDGFVEVASTGRAVKGDGSGAGSVTDPVLDRSIAACCVGDRVVVVHSIPGEGSLLVVALDATGRPLDKGVFFAVPHALFRESLPVGGGSGEHVFVAVTARDCDAMEDRLRLVDVGTPLVPCLTELGQWDAIVGRQVNVVSRGDETTWTLIAVKHNESRTDVELHLAYAFGVGTSLPALRKTKIPSELLAHVAGEHEIVALTGTRSSIELWSLPRKGEPRRIGEIARARQRSYFTDVRIVRLRDGFALLWYVYPTGSGSGPVGGLWGRTCSPTFDDLDSPLRLVRDDDASYDEWRAFKLGDGSVVLYGTGDDGDPVRQLRWRERRDVANEEAKPFAGRPPLALVPTSEGTIAITAYEDGPRTRVCARLMDI